MVSWLVILLTAGEVYLEMAGCPVGWVFSRKKPGFLDFRKQRGIGTMRFLVAGGVFSSEKPGFLAAGTERNRVFWTSASRGVSVPGGFSLLEVCSHQKNLYRDICHLKVIAVI